MHALLLAALAAFAGPARAGSAGDQLCGATGNSAGCIGTVQPTSHYEAPERPDCDEACRQQRRDDERYALSHIVEPGEVDSLDPVGYREDRTVASYIKGDDNENKVLLACVLVIAVPIGAPEWLVGVIGTIVVTKLITSYPGSNLERYVSAIWDSRVSLDHARDRLSRVDPGELSEHDRELGTNPRNGKFKETEAEAGKRLEKRTGSLKRDPSDAGDWIDADGKVYDAVGPLPKGQPFDEKKFNESIDRHTKKQVDVIVIDVARRSPAEEAAIRRHIDGFSPADKERIIVQGSGEQ